jgi:hypothetical protein
MFSPVKAITAGALIFAIGGALLIAQPFDQRAAVAPGAEADFAQPVEVTGTLESGECEATPDHRGEGNQDLLPGARTLWTCIGPAAASDPRLAGASTFLADWQSFRGNGHDASERLTAGCDADDECILPQFGLGHSARSIENDGGIWHQRPFVQVESSAGMDYGEQNPVIHVFDGEGTYEGLVAVLEVSGDSEYDFSDASHDFWGYILDARQLRGAPETASVR